MKKRELIWEYISLSITIGIIIGVVLGWIIGKELGQLEYIAKVKGCMNQCQTLIGNIGYDCFYKCARP
jgi:uncharacterized membrane-anchored protein YhcB (DUF1043 family)